MHIYTSKRGTSCTKTDLCRWPTTSNNHRTQQLVALTRCQNRSDCCSPWQVTDTTHGNPTLTVDTLSTIRHRQLPYFQISSMLYSSSLMLSALYKPLHGPLTFISLGRYRPPRPTWNPTSAVPAAIHHCYISSARWIPKTSPHPLSLTLSCRKTYIYRVIHKSLRDFRTQLRNNQDRHGRKEHINR